MVRHLHGRPTYASHAVAAASGVSKTSPPPRRTIPARTSFQFPSGFEQRTEIADNWDLRTDSLDQLMFTDEAAGLTGISQDEDTSSHIEPPSYIETHETPSFDNTSSQNIMQPNLYDMPGFRSGSNRIRGRIPVPDAESANDKLCITPSNRRAWHLSPMMRDEKYKWRKSGRNQYGEYTWTLELLEWQGIKLKPSSRYLGLFSNDFGFHMPHDAFFSDDDSEEGEIIDVADITNDAVS